MIGKLFFFPILKTCSPKYLMNSMLQKFFKKNTSSFHSFHKIQNKLQTFKKKNIILPQIQNKTETGKKKIPSTKLTYPYLGKKENHRLKSAFLGEGYVSSQEGILVEKTKLVTKLCENHNLSHPKGQEVVMLLESHVWSAQVAACFFQRVGGWRMLSMWILSMYITYKCTLMVL